MNEKLSFEIMREYVKMELLEHLILISLPEATPAAAKMIGTSSDIAFDPAASVSDRRITSVKA